MLAIADILQAIILVILQYLDESNFENMLEN